MGSWQTFTIQSIEYAIKTGELSIEQQRGIITLLPPKNKNHHLLKNWRPISLLNTDYKIIAKLIVNRIKTVLPLIINEDQTEYLKDRYSGENIRLLQDVTFYTEQRHINTILLLCIDFEKAFDSLNWEFLIKVLKHVNFGEDIIDLIKMMYNNIESTVINNGNTSEYFKLERGVSCPLSAYLFILAIEVLASKIRYEKNITCLKIDNKIIKLTLLADDLTLILKDLLSVENALKLLRKFIHCSGLKINID